MEVTRTRSRACTREDGRAYWRAYYAANRDREKERKRAWREANPEEARARGIRYRATHGAKMREREFIRRSIPAERIKDLAYRARERAKARGLVFDACAVESAIANPPVNCACCGRCLDYSTNRNGRNPRKSLSPSLDRIDNTKGYETGNVAVICVRCNGVKSDGTAEEFKHILRYMGGS